jgi:hypothetical protein
MSSDPNIDFAQSKRITLGRAPGLSSWIGEKGTGIPEWGNPSPLPGVDSERSQGHPKGKESTSSDEDDDLKELFAAGSNGAASPTGLNTRKEASVSWECSAPVEAPSSLEAALDEGQQVLEEIHRCSGVDIVAVLRSRPASPVVIPRAESSTQTDKIETSAPDSEKSGPRCIQDKLTKTVEGIQHVLLTLSQGVKKLVTDKVRARKAHARRERRRAERQTAIGYQPPQFPVDSPLGLHQYASTRDIVGSKAEAGTQPPTEDWARPIGVIRGQG